MIQIVLQRHVGEGVFKLSQSLEPEEFTDQAKGMDTG